MAIFPVPWQDVTNQILPGEEIITGRESLGSDIPAMDGIIANLFLQCTCMYVGTKR